jgi:hypothetical protein
MKTTTTSDDLFSSVVEPRRWPNVHGVESNRHSDQVSRLTSDGLVKDDSDSPQNINAMALLRLILFFRFAERPVVARRHSWNFYTLISSLKNLTPL